MGMDGMVVMVSTGTEGVNGGRITCTWIKGKGGGEGVVGVSVEGVCVCAVWNDLLMGEVGLDTGSSSSSVNSGIGGGDGDGG